MKREIKYAAIEREIFEFDWADIKDALAKQYKLGYREGYRLEWEETVDAAYGSVIVVATYERETAKDDKHG